MNWIAYRYVIHRMKYLILSMFIFYDWESKAINSLSVPTFFSALTRMAYITRINLALWYPSNQYEVNPNISREQILSRQELVKIHSKDRQLTLMSIEVLLSDLLFDRSYLNIVLEIPFALAIWLINTNLFQLMTIKTIQQCDMNIILRP